MNWSLTEQSLCQITGISPDLECRLRRSGVTSISMLECRCDDVFASTRAKRVRTSINRYRKFKELGLTDGIVNSFPCGHRVRVLHDMLEHACFLDVETDGKSQVTCISTHLYDKTESFLLGRNLDDFLDVWKRAKIVVSFNGRRFDIPLVLRTFGLTSVPAQIDLMDEARHYGLSGGLKQIEKTTGFIRGESKGMNGLDAVDLWRCYKSSGDEGAVEKLMRYNRDDVESLLALYHCILPLSLENGLFIDN